MIKNWHGIPQWRINGDIWFCWPKEGLTKNKCHADGDGDCSWTECPQLKHYDTYCPIAKAREEDTPELFSR